MQSFLATSHFTPRDSWAPYINRVAIGAAIASTDPATLVPVFKQVPIWERPERHV